MATDDPRRIRCRFGLHDWAASMMFLTPHWRCRRCGKVKIG